MILLRRYQTNNTKKTTNIGSVRACLRQAGIFRKENPPAINYARCCPLQFFLIFQSNFCHYSCLFKINQSILYSAIFKFRPSDKFRPSIFGTQFFYFFQIRKQAKKSAIIFSYQSQISIRFMLDLTYLKIHISVPKSIPSE